MSRGGNALIVSVSGIRGIVGREFTPDLAVAFAAALGTYAQGGRIVVGRDGRPSGEMLRHAVLAGLLAAGSNVEDVGILPTPTLGLAVRHLQSAGGIQITASHNPAEWNGLKLFGPEGKVLDPGEGRQVQALFEARSFLRAGWNTLGQTKEVRQAGAWHRDRVLELVNGPGIRHACFRILLDANGGAGGPLGCDLLEALNCQLICQGCDADGRFAHEPEPVAANLESIVPLVRTQGANIGFVLDPDADRLALIDETGHYIGEELTLALAVWFRLQREGTAAGPVVINMSTSRVVEDIAHRYGASCLRAPVGEANVVAMMRATSAGIGGEGNGGVIDPRVGLVRDPFIGMGLVLNLMAESGKPLSALVAELPAYTIVKTKLTVDRDRLSALFAAVEARWPGAVVNRSDGLRLDWPDRWLHVRPSNTEPIIRIIAEAPEAAAAEALCQDVGRLLQ
jgi:phosphomannomutase